MTDPRVDVNPFAYKHHFPWYKMPQVALMTLSVAPLRVMSLTVVNVSAWLIAVLMLWFTDTDKLQAEPLSGWRRKVKNLLYWMGRFSLYFYGITKVHVKGKPARPREISAYVCAPHTSFFDSMVLFLLEEAPSVIAKHSASRVPILGTLLKCTQPILVYREDRESKINSLRELARRSDSGASWPPILVFPEGTTTNGKALLKFKHGVFTSGKPVQPVLIKYTDSWNTTTWTWLGGAPGWQLAWLSLCKSSIGVSIEYLPVYIPSREEIEDSHLYAENVRQYMARALKISTSNLTLDDAKRMLQEETKSSQ